MRKTKRKNKRRIQRIISLTLIVIAVVLISLCIGYRLVLEKKNKGAIDAGGKLIEVLDGIVKSGNAIPAVATAIAAAFSFKNVGIDTLVAY